MAENIPNVSSDGMPMKGIGNSCTTPTDLKDIESMKLYILSLSEMVAMRLRDAQKCANVLCVSLRTQVLITTLTRRKWK